MVAPRIARLLLAGATICLGLVAPGMSQERSEEELKAAYERQVMRPTDFVKVLAGKWEAVPDLQQTFDDLSQRPGANGRFKNFQIEFVDLETFWNYRNIRDDAESMKKKAAQYNHQIIGAGMSSGEAGSDGFSAFFLLTQCEGETFLGMITFGGVATFEPWRLHYVDANKPANSLLIIEMGPKDGGQQVVVFRRAASEPQ